MAKLSLIGSDPELESNLDCPFLFSPFSPAPGTTQLPHPPPPIMVPLQDLSRMSGLKIAGLQPVKPKAGLGRRDLTMPLIPLPLQPNLELKVGGMHSPVVACTQRLEPTVGSGGIELNGSVNPVDAQLRREAAKVTRKHRILKMKTGRGRTSAVTAVQPKDTEEFVDGRLTGRTDLRYLLKKKLTLSDVNKLGRIILPKKLAEAYLPELKEIEGTILSIRDIFSEDYWTIKYRYWINKKGKIYVFGNIGKFIVKYNLELGDTVALYQDKKNKYFLCPGKADGTLNHLLPPTVQEEGEGH